MKKNTSPASPRKSLAQQVAQQLQQQIESGRLAVGEQLPTEPALMKQYGVGRSTVREAVRMLMNTGQVSVQQGRGTFVLRRTPAEESLSQRLERALPDESAEVLALLEGMMARLAANRRTAEQLNRMDETLLRRRQMAERHDAHGVDETEQQFYDLLARAAGNPLLTDLHHALAHSLRTRTAPYGSQPETDDDLQAMYENLVRQITEQNAKKSGKIAQNIRTAHH